MEIRATEKYIRMAPRKARIVAKEIKGMAVEDALSTLKFIQKKAANNISKLLIAAQANAQQKEETKGKELYVGNALVDEGPSLKRVKIRARGRRDIIKKRTSHVTVVLNDGGDE